MCPRKTEYVRERQNVSGKGRMYLGKTECVWERQKARQLLLNVYFSCRIYQTRKLHAEETDRNSFSLLHKAGLPAFPFSRMSQIMIYFHGSHYPEFDINRKKSTEKFVKFHFCPKLKCGFHETREEITSLELLRRTSNKSIKTKMIDKTQQFYYNLLCPGLRQQIVVKLLCFDCHLCLYFHQ